MEKDQVRQLNAKIQLDSKLKPKVKRLLKKIAKDFEKLYSEKGVIPNMQEYIESWHKLLVKHYQAVEDEFFGKAGEELGRKPTKEQVMLILLALAIMRQERASESSRQISDTNSEQIEESIEKAKQNLTESGLSLENSAVALLASQFFRDKIDGRSATIAMTETQFIAETSKNIEADALTNNKNLFLDAAVESNPDFLASAYVIGAAEHYEKEWLSALLPTTREAHAAAHGQTVASDELFYVGGEYLKYPGDSSHGASAGNLINCYCQARYNKLK